MISIEEAYQLIAQHVVPLPMVETELSQSVGRVLGTDIRADIDSPPHRKSVMDGFAIRSGDLNSGTKVLTVVETIVAGTWPKKSIGPGEAARIMTGAPVPEGADCVVMIELTETVTETDALGDHGLVRISLESIQPGKHLMERSSNFATGDTVFTAGHRIRPTDIGLLAEVGAHQLMTSAQPTAAFLPTGDELVPYNTVPEKSQIRNSNGPMLIALSQKLGLATTDLGIGRDNRADLQAAVKTGLQHDLLILSGGVSAGVLDLVPEILQDAGVEQIFHKVKIKPGKPIWFGVLTRDGRNCFVFGLPGNPVSSLVGFQLFVRTAIKHLEHDPVPQRQPVMATLASVHETRGDRPTYWPGHWVATSSSVRTVGPLEWHGSSDLLALGSADGLIYFPGETNQHQAGIEVAFYPFD